MFVAALNLFNVPFNDMLTIALVAAAGLLGFLGTRRPTDSTTPATPQTGFAGPLARLAGRASTLLQHVQSLGLPALVPLLKDVAQGNWLAVPGHVHSLLDSLDDKTLRGGVLDTLFRAQLQRQLESPERQAALLRELEQRLGVTFKVPAE